MAILQKWLKFEYMKFVEIINNKKFTLISIFLFLYVIFNLLDGERGLISYYEKQQVIEKLFQEKKSLLLQLNSIEKKNSLLTDNINIDYLDMLYREKLRYGTKDEILIKFCVIRLWGKSK